jgi:hypothetical protein
MRIWGSIAKNERYPKSDNLGNIFEQSFVKRLITVIKS